MKSKELTGCKSTRNKGKLNSAPWNKTKTAFPARKKMKSYEYPITVNILQI